MVLCSMDGVFKEAMEMAEKEARAFIAGDKAYREKVSKSMALKASAYFARHYIEMTGKRTDRALLSLLGVLLEDAGFTLEEYSEHYQKNVGSELMITPAKCGEGAHDYVFGIKITPEGWKLIHKANDGYATTIDAWEMAAAAGLQDAYEADKQKASPQVTMDGKPCRIDGDLEESDTEICDQAT